MPVVPPRPVGRIPVGGERKLLTEQRLRPKAHANAAGGLISGHGGEAGDLAVQIGALVVRGHTRVNGGGPPSLGRRERHEDRAGLQLAGGRVPRWTTGRPSWDGRRWSAPMQRASCLEYSICEYLFATKCPANTSKLLAVDYPCTCRGVNRPHAHYFIRRDRLPEGRD